MTLPKMRWNRSNMQLLLNRRGVQEDLTRRCEAIAQACGGEAAGYVARSGTVNGRARAAVLTLTYEARNDNAANQTLVNNLDAGK